MSQRHEIGLLDTSVVIDLGRLSASDLPIIPRVATITLAELGLGVQTASEPAERALRTERLQLVEANFRPLPVHCRGGAQVHPARGPRRGRG